MKWFWNVRNRKKTTKTSVAEVKKHILKRTEEKYEDNQKKSAKFEPARSD